jgi:tellurite resistance protein TerC
MGHLLWCIFIGITSVGLLADIVALGRGSPSSNLKKSTGVVAVWFSLALAFGGLVYLFLGVDAALQFFTGYLLELSLSVDNLFVFMAIFSSFKIVGAAQQKALTYGIGGAILMRMLFIFAGITLLNRFHWLVYALGIMLIFSAIAMLKSEKKGNDVKILTRALKNFLPVGESKDGLAFFVRVGTKRCVTPLLLCVFAIEFSDIIFAADSVSAVLAITRTPLIVFSSNVFAIIGLRALYTYLVRLTGKFYLLKYGIIVNLVFVGLKMICSGFFHVPTGVAIVVIVSVIAIAIVASIYSQKKQRLSSEVGLK